MINHNLQHPQKQPLKPPAASHAAFPIRPQKQDSPFGTEKGKQLLAEEKSRQAAAQAAAAARPEVAPSEAATPAPKESRESYFYSSTRTKITLPASEVNKNPVSGNPLDTSHTSSTNIDHITEKQASTKARYDLHDHAAELIEAAGNIPGGKRMIECGRTFGRARDADGNYTTNRPAALRVRRTQDNEVQASIHNTFQCENPACPICAWKRDDNNVRRMTRCIADPNMKTKINLFVTPTMKHHAGDTVRQCIDDYKAVCSMFRSNEYSSPVTVAGDITPVVVYAVQGWKSFCAEWGIENVTANDDFTWGNNGPNFHQHWMMTLDGEKYRPIPEYGDYTEDSDWPALPLCEVDPQWFAPYLAAFTEALFERWEMCCERVNPKRKPIRAAFDVQLAKDNEQALQKIADYMNKWHVLPKRMNGWNSAKELFLGRAKVGREGRTIFELLADSMAGDVEAGRRYLEFVVARYRKHHVSGVAELERLLGVDTSIDLYPEDHTEPVSEFWIEFEYETWVEICRRRLRAALLIYAEQNPTEEAINRWLYVDQDLPWSRLGRKPGLAGGTLRDVGAAPPNRRAYEKQSRIA